MKKSVFHKLAKPSTTVKRLFWTNLLMLAIGTVILSLFLVFLQKKSAEYQQEEESVAVLDEIVSALDQNDKEISSLTDQYHEMNQSRLKSLKRLFNYGDYKEILDKPLAYQQELFMQAWNSIRSGLLLMVDENGDIQIMVDEYKDYQDSSSKVEKNIIALGLIDKDSFEQLITGGEPVVCSFENGDYYYYSIGLKLKEDKPIYLVSCEPARILEMELQKLNKLSSVMEDITVGATGFAFATDTSTGKFIYFVDGTNDLTGQDYSDCGLGQEALADQYRGRQTINGVKYHCVSEGYESSVYGSNLVITAAEREATVMERRGQVIGFALVTFLLVVILIAIYSYSIQYEIVIRGRKSEMKKLFTFRGEEYFLNKTVLSSVLPVAIAGLFFIFIASMYSQSLLALSTAISRSVTSHVSIANSVTQNDEVIDDLTDYYEEQYVSKGKMASYLLEETPRLVFGYDIYSDDCHPAYDMNGDKLIDAKDSYGNICYSVAYSERLQEICDDNDFETLYIFDDKGRVRATNASEWYFHLSTDPADQSYPFRDVLEGKQDVYVQKLGMSENNEYMQYIGFPYYYYTYKAENGKTEYASRTKYKRQKEQDYDGPTITRHRGLLQIGISGEQVSKIMEVTSLDYMLSKMHVINNGYIIAFGDDEEHKILYAPWSEKIGKNAEELGFSKEELLDQYNGFKTIQNTKCFVIVREDKGYSVATAIPVVSLYQNRNLVAFITLLAGLIFISMLLLRSVIMPKKRWKEYSQLIADMNEDVYQTKSEMLSTDANVAHKTPEQVLSMVIGLYVMLIAAAIWIYASITYKGLDDGSLLSYILQFNWSRKLNIISATACGIILISVVAAVNVLEILVKSLTKSLGQRSVTIGHLLMACFKFLAVAIAVFVCFFLVGFDSRSLLTSAGVLSVVIGFGAQSLIGDILAGIFIVFEGSFRVGDFVTIGDFRGEVLEIGLRTTKIENDNFDVKIFNNSTISGIINMTKENSFAVVTSEVAYESDLSYVESVLRGNFEQFRKDHKEIVAELVYKGVTSLNESGIEITIWAPCYEKDRPVLENSLRKDIVDLYNKNKISIPYPHVVVCEQDGADTPEVHN